MLNTSSLVALVTIVTRRVKKNLFRRVKKIYSPVFIQCNNAICTSALLNNQKRKTQTQARRDQGFCRRCVAFQQPIINYSDICEITTTT